MTHRKLITPALALLLGALPLAAQVPGDPDYEPGDELFEQYELLGDGSDGDVDVDQDAFDQAQGQTVQAQPALAAPSGDEVKEFRAGLEAHWNGNLPALHAYLASLDPAAGDNPEPPEEGGAAGWNPTTDYDGLGNVIETADEKRRRWRRRVEQKLAQLAAR